MECHEAESYVSVLYDGEPVPPDAAAHVRACAACRARLRDYADLAAELRLLAGQQQATVRLPAALPQRPPSLWRWLLTERMWVPRYAVATAVILILGLSAGFGWVQAQPRGPWFEFELRSADGVGATGQGLLVAGSGSPVTLLLGHPEGSLGCMVTLEEVRSGAVRLMVRAKRMADQEMTPASLDSLAPQEHWYYPGQALTIPVEGGGQLVMTGELLSERPVQVPWEGPINPEPNQIAFSQPLLVRDQELVSDSEGASASATGARAVVAIYEPSAGLFVWSLQPFEGAVAGEAYRAQARATFEGKQYLLSSATPITGGEQPRPIWFYHDPSYKPSRFSSGFTTAASDVSELLERLKK